MDNYVLEHKPIGQGSFGTVFRGRRRGTDEIYALKIIPIENHVHGNGQKEDLSLLLRECQMQNKLKHKNIIQMFEYFKTENGSSLVIVSECANCSLFALLEREKRLDLQHVQKYAREITSALYYMHSKCIIHRDLKPQNVLIGKDGQAKLCDFGFARNLSNNKFLLTSVKGTPLYMSPELIGREPYDERTDLWSFGCILYELLVGTPPYSTNSIFELTRKIVQEDVQYFDFIKGDCRSFLQGLLEKDQEKRIKWKYLIHHPFVAGCVDETTISHELNSLTIMRTPSQELAKQTDLERTLRMKKFERLLHGAKYHDAASRAQNMAIGYNNLLPLSPRVQQQVSGLGIAANGNFRNQVPKTKHKKTSEDTQLAGNPFTERREPVDHSEDSEEDSGSSCETLTSSSNSGSEEEENETDDLQTVVGARGNPGKHDEQLSDGNGLPRDKANKPKSLDLCDSGVFSRIENQKPIESEEWVYFLKRTMKEIVECPDVLCDKHFLNVIVTPLRNPHSSSIVVENIAFLLTLPFPLANANDLELHQKMLNLYLEGKVVPNLVSACLLIVQRRKLSENLKSYKNLETLLTDEEIISLERCLQLISFLMLTDERFIVPFCDSIGILSGYILLELFIKCWDRKKELALYALNFLTIVLEKDPRRSFVEIIETLFLDEDSNDYLDIWELITNTGTEVRSRALRLLGLLLVRSRGTRDKFLNDHNSNRLWDLIESLKSHESDEVKKAAAFAGRLISYTGFVPRNQIPPAV